VSEALVLHSATEAPPKKLHVARPCKQSMSVNLTGLYHTGRTFLGIDVLELFGMLVNTDVG